MNNILYMSVHNSRKFLKLMFFILVLNNINSAKYRRYDYRHFQKSTFYWSSTIPGWQFCKAIILVKDNIYIPISRKLHVNFNNFIPLFYFAGSNFEYKLKLKDRLKFLAVVNLFSGYYRNKDGDFLKKNGDFLDFFSFGFGFEWKYRKSKNYSGSLTFEYSLLNYGGSEANEELQLSGKNLFIDITFFKYEFSNGIYIQSCKIRYDLFDCHPIFSYDGFLSIIFNLINCHIGININTIHRNRRFGKKLL